MEPRITTRALTVTRRNDALGGGFLGSFALHTTFVVLILLCTWIAARKGKNWGDSSTLTGAIQATMVNDIPLPPKPDTNQDSILATDTASTAPVTSTAHTVEAPQPNALALAAKPTTKPLKVADKSAPPPPLHPQPTQANPNKAQSGEAGGLSIAMSSTQTQAGTVSVGTADSAFGTRFAYYIQQIRQKVAAQWYPGMLDSQAVGHKVFITFQVERDGSVTNIKIAQRSGDFTLDQTAINAVRHIDTFGPLPEAYTGTYINVTYYFEPPTR
jgi:protein TonB